MKEGIPVLKIGFYDPFSIFSTIKPQLEEKIVLHNVHWKLNDKDHLKSIEQIPIKFEEEKPKQFDEYNGNTFLELSSTDIEKSINDIYKFHSIPYVRVILVRCDDMDNYRSQVRPLIKEWIKSNIDRKFAPLEWLVIDYMPKDGKNRLKIFEKLKVDFNELNCFKLKEVYESKAEENEVLNLIINKIKSSILNSFKLRLEIVQQRMAAFKNNSDLIMMNLIESVSLEYLKLRLNESALKEYDELINKFIFTKTFEDYSDDGASEILKPKKFHHYLEQQHHICSINKIELLAHAFAKKSIILYSLAKAESSLSLASIHLSEIFSVLQKFIQKINHVLMAHPSKSNEYYFEYQEWFIQIIDYYQSLDLCKKIKSLIDNDQDFNFIHIYEKFGEILTEKKSILMKIGSGLGYEIKGILSGKNLLLEDAKVEPKINYNTNEMFKSYKSFEDEYLLITEEIIKFFSKSERTRYVDSLSIEIAIIDYYNGNYENAATILSTCPSFYSNQGWDLISFNLLVKFIDCVELIEARSDFFKNQDDELFKDKNTWLCILYLDLISIIKQNSFNALKKHLHSKLSNETIRKQQSLKLPLNTINYDLNKVFDISISNKVIINSNKSDDVYSIEIEIINHFNESFKLNDLNLTLINESSRTFEFVNDEHEAISIKPGLNQIILSTTKIIIGCFKIHEFKALSNNVLFYHEITDADFDIVVYPFTNNLQIDLNTSTIIKLSEQTFSVFIKTGSLDYENPCLHITPITENMKVLNNCVLVESGASDEQTKLNKTTDDFSINLPNLHPNTEYQVIIQYEIESIINSQYVDLELMIELSYNKDYKQVLQKKIETSLSIAVSVQDIFKSTSLYAKFSIGTAESDLPIRIYSTTLNSNDYYNVTTALPADELIAFGEQPGNYFYKIDKVDRAESDLAENKFLQLDIRYIELSTQIREILLLKVGEKLGDGKDYFYLLRNLINKFEFELDQFAIHDKIKINNLDTVLEKDETFRYLVKHDDGFEETLTALLKEEDNDTVGNSKSNVKHLLINVDIPTVEVIHTIEFKYNDLGHYSIGESIKAELKIESIINKFEETAKSNKKVVFKEEVCDSFKYYVEIMNNEDSWLVNGKTKFQIEVLKTEVNKLIKFPAEVVDLIPLKIGKLSLPKVKITNLNIEGNGMDYVMEIDYKNESETINVVSENVM